MLLSELLRVGSRCNQQPLPMFHFAHLIVPEREACEGENSARCLRSHLRPPIRKPPEISGRPEPSWQRLVGTPESASIMVDDHNPEYIESKPLNTEMETLAPEATAEIDGLSSESTPTTVYDRDSRADSSALSEDPASGHLAESSPLLRKRPPRPFKPPARNRRNMTTTTPTSPPRSLTSTANRPSKPPPRRALPRKKSSSPER